jgi:peroxiredoxin
MFCREQVAQLLQHKDDFRARGAQLVLIGNGEPHFARAFAEDYQVDYPLVVDPSLRTYKAAKLRGGLGTTLSRKVLANGRRATKAGFKQGRTQGAAMQQGGAMVVAQSGEVAWSFASEVAGDHPEPSEILQVLDRL